VCGSINIVTYKGEHKNAVEKFHTYKLSKRNQQLNDSETPLKKTDFRHTHPVTQAKKNTEQATPTGQET
jgi:hypothetical protein